MPYPTISDAQVTRDKPLDETLMGELRERDAWLWELATNGGTGIAPAVAAFIAGLAAHSHDGTDGEGQPIDTPGIADEAVFDPEMIDDDAVSAGKVAGTTMSTENFAGGSVTLEKLAGVMGVHITGSQAYDTEAPPGAGDQVFEGDSVSFGGPLGVVCNVAPTSSGVVDFFIRSMGGGQIRLGFRVGSIVGSGTFEWDFWVM